MNAAFWSEMLSKHIPEELQRNPQRYQELYQQLKTQNPTLSFLHAERLGKSLKDHYENDSFKMLWKIGLEAPETTTP